ncbi:MAG: DNA mismatch repair endonuclease MutL [Gemmatimonadota bacterium]|nr:DNA mismatch repair endonuclease MutL [Gemmatimonadota bacterium]
MPRIAVLPSAVVDQIAAGEVVERPASVVKELVENALDAGATAIEIEVEEGGRARIRVADDGVGMEREDALLALCRHATSKIRAAADLVGVDSFGFRGEALPAIASVSELELETAAADGAGTRLRVMAGELTDTHDAARRRGTTVSVSRLFFNSPQRQRFLHSARGEWRGIVEVVTAIGLTRRDVRIAASHDGRQVLALPAASSLRARVGALWGGAAAERLVELDDVRGALHLSGLIERPGDVGTVARRIFLSVNGRAIRDAGLLRAAEAAYRSTIPSGSRPSLLLELVMPADMVDVNVHPAKAEVRFRERWPLERAIEQAVRRALGTTESAVSMAPRWSSAGTATLSSPVDVEALRPTVQLDPAGGLALERRGVGAIGGMSATAVDTEIEVPPLLQLHRTYMMFEHDEGVVLIDQHSAHERVLFERFMAQLEGGAAASQRLLFPLTLHLGPAEGDAFESRRDALERLGFEIEGFGGHTLIVSAVPMPHPRFDAPRCLRETLDALTGDREPGTAPRHERLAATLACKAAIKGGELLSQAEMRALFVALARTTLPSHDVHGRSTIVRLPWDEVERRFGRR